MCNLGQTVFSRCLRFVTDTIVIKIEFVAAVPTWVDAKCNGVHLSLRVQLPDVLFQFPLGNNGAFTDVYSAVVSAFVIPRGIEVKLYPSIYGSSKWRLVVCETVPLAPSREVHGSICLTLQEEKSVSTM